MALPFSVSGLHGHNVLKHKRMATTNQNLVSNPSAPLSWGLGCLLHEIPPQQMHGEASTDLNSEHMPELVI